MKKFVSFFAAILFAGTMAAEVITITPADITDLAEGAGSFTKTVKGITLSWDGAYYNGGNKAELNDLRVYAEKSMTISASQNITKVEIDGYCKKGFSLSANAGTITKGASYSSETTAAPLIVISNINAKSVTLSCAKQLQAKVIRVTIGEAGDDDGGEGGDPQPSGDAVVVDVAYADVSYFGDEQMWQINLYKDYDIDTEVVTYPDLYIGVDPKSPTAIAGTYSGEQILFVEMDLSASNTVEAVTYSDLVVTCVEDYVYRYQMTFEADNNKKYILDVTLETAIYDGITYEDIVPTDQPQAIENTSVEKKAVKILRNGTITIISNDKAYNLQGQQIR